MTLADLKLLIVTLVDPDDDGAVLSDDSSLITFATDPPTWLASARTPDRLSAPDGTPELEVTTTEFERWCEENGRDIIPVDSLGEFLVKTGKAEAALAASQ